jgi:hypothetical protein
MLKLDAQFFYIYNLTIQVANVWISNQILFQGENTVKKARGAKVKVLFQGLHMTCVVFVLVYNLKICIFIISCNTTF